MAVKTTTIRRIQKLAVISAVGSAIIGGYLAMIWSLAWAVDEFSWLIALPAYFVVFTAIITPIAYFITKPGDDFGVWTVDGYEGPEA